MGARLSAATGLMVLASLLGPVRAAHATDYWAPRLDAGFGHAQDTFHEVSAGFDYDFFAEYLGARLGAVVTARGYVDGGYADDGRLLLSPEVAVHPGCDAAFFRVFLVLQPELGLLGFERGTRFLHGVRLGPQLEWRHTPEGVRLGLGVFYTATHDRSDEMRWAGVSVRLGVSYAFSTSKPVRHVTGEPRCPDGAPPIEGYGCESVR